MANENGGFPAIMKAWLPLVLSFEAAIVALATSLNWSPAIALAAAGAALLWLFLLYVRLTKRSQFHNPIKKHFKYGTRSRALALTGLVIMPALAGVLLYVRTRPPRRIPPPPDKLAVVIAGFTPDSPATADRAQAIAASLGGKLKSAKEADKNLALSFDTFPGQQIHQPGDGEKDDARAKDFGQLKGAHLVIWGEVFGRGGGQLQVMPTVSVAYDWMTDKGAVAEDAGNFKLVLTTRVFEPTDEKGLDKQLEVLARLIVGVAYYRADKWEEAIGFFSAQDDIGALLWLGSAYLQQADAARQRDERSKSLDKAVESYEGLIQSMNNPEELVELSALAHWRLGNACLKRSLFDRKNEFLGRAKDAFRQSEREYNRMGAGQIPWQLENNLGGALNGLADLGDGAINYLQQANAAYSLGLGILHENADGTIPPGGCGTIPNDAGGEDQHKKDVSELYKNRGSVRSKWGQLLQSIGQRGSDQLECARSDLSKALTLQRSLARRDREQEAAVENDLANALAQLANETPGEKGDGLFEESIRYYGDALMAFPVGGLDYTRVQKSRAETYYDQGERSKKADLLDRAISEYIEVIRVLRTTDTMEELADALRYQAKARTALYDLRQGCDPVCLSSAISAFQEAERIFAASRTAQDVHDVHQELVAALKKAQQPAPHR